MYPCDFKSKRQSINHQEIFVVMPFEAKFDEIFNKLIVPATAKANELMGRSASTDKLSAYRSKEDIRTVSGWVNILEHLTTAQIVLGVLDSNNANVFYELGIAHATQPSYRQILVASKGYERKFDTKDLIYLEHEGTPTDANINDLAARIKDSIDGQNLEAEKLISQARMSVTPMGLAVIMTYGAQSNFGMRLAKDFKLEYIKTHGEDSFDHHLMGIENLCEHGLLGLNIKRLGLPQSIVFEFSYWWTGLGNDVLAQMRLIRGEEVRTRAAKMPEHF